MSGKILSPVKKNNNNALQIKLHVLLILFVLYGFVTFF